MMGLRENLDRLINERLDQMERREVTPQQWHRLLADAVHRAFIAHKNAEPPSKAVIAEIVASHDPTPPAQPEGLTREQFLNAVVEIERTAHKGDVVMQVLPEVEWELMDKLKVALEQSERRRAAAEGLLNRYAYQVYHDPKLADRFHSDVGLFLLDSGDYQRVDLAQSEGEGKP